MVFLHECLEWLDTVKSLGSRQPPCLEGWKMAIRALKLLWIELCEKHNFKYLNTNRLNQDCVENLFSVIRGKGGQLDRPDATQFRASLKQIMVDRILITSDTANCEDDMDEFLFKMNDPAAVSSSRSAIFTNSSSATPLECDTHPEVLSMAEENIVFYISGYISRKVCPKLCTSCQQDLKGTADAANTSATFLLAKQLEGTKTGLTAPSTKLFEMCEAAEVVFRDVIESVFYMDNVRSRLLSCLRSKVECPFTCPTCDASSRVFKLFCNIRLHHHLRESNRSFLCVKGRKNRKVLKFAHV